ncbi:MAG: 5-formyltetrahydrofolate cyclo-ligase [Actinomycetota bacterium]
MRDQGYSRTEKQAVRDRVWARLEQAGAGRYPGTHGRIPNFEGADQAALRLAGEVEWRRAGRVEANADPPQRPLRALALAEGRKLYVAQPRLRTLKPFLKLDPDQLVIPLRHAASIDGAQAAGTPVSAEEIPRVDVFVCGAVAVNPAGVVIGDGNGYCDLRAALSYEAGIIDEYTVIVATVHESQVLDEDLPAEAHDIRVDIIATPERIIRADARTDRSARARTPSGIEWSLLSEEQIRSMPAIAALRRRQEGNGNT